jgi:hypothetical protein
MKRVQRFGYSLLEMALAIIVVLYMSVGFTL